MTRAMAAGSAVRHGLKQIQENPGGIILNYEQNTFSLETLKDVLRKRSTASATQDVDILVICKEKLFTVQRFTAKNRGVEPPPYSGGAPHSYYIAHFRLFVNITFLFS